MAKVEEAAARSAAHLVEVERSVLDGVEDTDRDRRQHALDAGRAMSADHFEPAAAAWREQATPPVRASGRIDDLDVGCAAVMTTGE